jgi:hypothetical protein
LWVEVGVEVKVKVEVKVETKIEIEIKTETREKSHCCRLTIPSPLKDSLCHPEGVPIASQIGRPRDLIDSAAIEPELRSSITRCHM